MTSRNQGTFCKEEGRGLWERGCVRLRMLTYFRLSGPKKHSNSFQYIFWTKSNYIWISWSTLNFMIPRVIVWQIQRLIFGVSIKSNKLQSKLTEVQYLLTFVVIFCLIFQIHLILWLPLLLLPLPLSSL